MKKRTCYIRPALERLEDRLVPYSLSGQTWANLAVSVSYMPDGTSMVGGYKSSLFATLDPRASTATWQREFARALQTWASVSPVDFHFVSDSGAPQGTTGLIQGDSRFGDIRLGAKPQSSSNLGSTYFPYKSTTLGGDISLNSIQKYNIGTSYDLYSVFVHEIGHALGLNHSTVYGSVMYPNIKGVYKGLAADDIAGIQKIYGSRQMDVYDAAAANNTLATATALTVTNGNVSFKANLTNLADLDNYRLIVPLGTDGTLTVSMDARNCSLLVPKVSVYNAAGTLVATANAGTAYGGVATVTLAGLVAGQTYTIAADGAATDVFGMGSYQLDVQFGGFSAGSSSSSLDGSMTSGSFSDGPAITGQALISDEDDDSEHNHGQPDGPQNWFIIQAGERTWEVRYLSEEHNQSHTSSDQVFTEGPGLIDTTIPADLLDTLARNRHASSQDNSDAFWVELGIPLGQDYAF